MNNPHTSPVTPSDDFTTASKTEALRLQSLVACAATGDESCFEDLYDALVPHIFGLVLRLMRNRALAEEVTQEIFLEVWQKVTLYDSRKGNVKTWVAVIAHRRAIDRIRATQSSLTRDLKQGQFDFQESYEHVSETVEKSLETQEVSQALRALPEDHAHIVTLAYFADLTQREIADQLDLPLGTVKSRMRSALLALRSTLGGTHAAA